METGNAMEFHFTFTIEIRFFEMVGKIANMYSLKTKCLLLGCSWNIL